MPQQKIEMPNSLGERLSGIFHKATGEMKIAIVCHGFLSTKEHPLVKELCTTLEKEGINCFRFDFAGKGGSQGDFGLSTYTKESQDIVCVIDYFEKLDYEITCVIGHSMGGAAALLAAARDVRIKSVIDIAGITYPERTRKRFAPELIEKCMREGSCEYEGKGGKVVLGKEFFEDALSADIFHIIKKVNVPLLFLIGERDATVLLEEFKKLYEKAYQPKGAKVFDDCDHDFKKKGGREEIAQYCAGWIKGKMAE
ncbi:MAG TPA: alpha/beta fold hydrolase [Candidatus Diapherotrites archaeon]|uniref:Alpha/beta fold hydrolase n=1 Tax=Candidatus Iainarchaeum sp. TaxID=3101447 RepID=A0A7J4IY18_9ARCH|nr:alpha/beta fold hydrolase [Candidatus Diapherotrites archaeon]